MVDFTPSCDLYFFSNVIYTFFTCDLRYFEEIRISKYLRLKPSTVEIFVGIPFVFCKMPAAGLVIIHSLIKNMYLEYSYSMSCACLGSKALPPIHNINVAPLT